MTIMLGAIRATALEEVDREAGVARLRYITDVPGQQAVYITKLQQAQAYIADTSTVPPYISAEADARGISPAAVAQLIVTTADLWSGVKGPAIEAERIRAKLAIEAAHSAEAIHAARDAGAEALRAL